MNFGKAIFLGTLVCFYVFIINDKRQLPRVVFCDVKQGDATYVRLPEQIDLLIDFGNYNYLNTCLNNNLPYFDRQIELAFLTHLDKDHSGALYKLIDNYNLLTLYVPYSLKNISDNYWQQLKNKLKQKKIKIVYLMSNQELTIQQSSILVLWPELTTLTKKTTQNQSALALLLEINHFRTLFLSDLEIVQIEKILRFQNLITNILKISHHGSKFGTSTTILQKTKPKLAIISVGKNNQYDHPDKYVLNLLKKNNIPVKRTDKEGAITIQIPK